MKKKSMFQKGIAAIALSAVFLCSLPVTVSAAAAAGEESLINENPETFCNPVNISYSYQYGLNRGTGGFRMLADPQPIYYQGEYWMFPTNATGYYHSKDLVNWEFVYSTTQQVNNYAPGVFEHGGYLYISRHSRGNLYRTKTPEQGNSWEYVRGTHCQDPFYFSDPDTGRLFEIHGCVGINNSDKDKNPPIYITELDTSSATLEPLPVDASVPGARQDAGYPVFYMDRERHGYEVPGQRNDDYNAGTRSWLEGGGMLKYKGRYYIYYSGPATECASYCEGCYVSDDPLGPYEWCDSSPFAYKSTGFTVGAGHGHHIVEQKSGRLWKFGSVAIASNDSWERCLNLYPLEFDKYDRPVTDQSVADYPMYVPMGTKGSFEQQGPDWNLVSYGITATASSTYDADVKSLGSGESFRIAPERAFDENIRTWWSAQTGNAGEWLMGDMGKVCTVNAVQLNFADQDAAVNDNLPDDLKNLSGGIRAYTGCYRYQIEYSLDGKTWKMLADKSDNKMEPFSGQDTSHDYYELKAGTPMRYVRVTNCGNVPAHGKFAISGLRLFGNGNGEAPEAVKEFALNRVDGVNERSVQVSWEPVQGAQGYIIRYGAKEDSLNIHYQAIGETSARINNLSTNRNYYFRIDTYNDSGRTVGTKLLKLPGSYGNVSYEAVSVTAECGEQPVLPQAVEAVTAAGKQTMKVRWNPIEPSLLEKEGTFTAEGIVQETGDPIQARVTVCGFLGVQTVTMAVAKGQQPELPKQVKVYYSNGESQEREVSWNLEGVDFGREGIAEVTGTVGTHTAKARIRVSGGEGIDFHTPMGENLALNKEGLTNPSSWPRALAYYSWTGDEVQHVTDGRKDFVSNKSKVVWSDWDSKVFHTNPNAQPGDADHLPFLAIAFGEKGTSDDGGQRKYTVNHMSIGFMQEDGDGAGLRLPADYKIEYYSANDGILPAGFLQGTSASDFGNTRTWAKDNPINAKEGWTEVTYIGGKPKVPDVSDFKHMVDVKFEPAATTVLRLTLTPQAKNWVAMEEIEAYYIPVEPYTDYEIEEIRVDGKDVLAQFDPQTKTLALDVSKGEVTASATNNASVTILSAVDGKAKVIFLPEDGNEAGKQEYTILYKAEEKPQVTAPVKVAGLKASSAKNSVTLTWKKVKGAEGYLVLYRKSGAKKFTQAADVKKTNYTHKKLIAATAYEYKVCAYKKDGKTKVKGAYSGAAKILTAPSAPSSVKIKRIGKAGSKTTANLSFGKVPRAGSYQIYQYNKKKKSYQTAYRVKNGKLYQYNSKTKKYKSLGKVKVKKGTYTCTLKNLNLKKEKSITFKMKAVVSKKGYPDKMSGYSKKASVK